MKKKLFKNIMTFSALCVLGVTGCSDSTQAYSSGERTTQEMSQTAPMQQSQETNEDENDTEPTASESVGILDNFMLVFAQAHSASSSVSITYPVFLDSKAEELNSIIYRKVQEVGQIDTALFSPDAALTAEYKSAVTLKNSKIVSIIFWGESSVDNSPDKTTNLTLYIEVPIYRYFYENNPTLITDNNSSFTCCCERKEFIESPIYNKNYKQS